MTRATLFVGVLVLSGCATIDYKDVIVDSAPPNLHDVPRCEATSRQKCLAQIRADRWTSPTGVMATQKGELFCMNILPNQVWFDEARRRVPPKGESGSWMMRLAPLRHPNYGYFALMVDVQSRETFDVSTTAEPVTTSTSFQFTAKSMGAIVMYPNDALGPKGAPDYFYTSNNKGFIWILIERRPCPT